MDGSLVCHRIMAIMKPILNQFQVVPDAAAINPNPMDTLDKLPL